MNEFIAFVILLWRIVRFFLDMISYTVCCILAVVSCMLPWRAVAISNGIALKTLTRSLCVTAFFWTIVEVVCLCVCLPSLVLPTRFVGFYRTLVDRETAQNMRSLDGSRYYAGLWFMFPFFALCEIVSFAFGLIALLSVIRSSETCKEANKAVKHGDIYPACFNIDLLLCLCGQGFLVIFDFFLVLPILLILCVTLWRVAPALRKLRDENYSWETRMLILKQFVWLLFDVFVVLPCLLLVSLTLYRLPSLLQSLGDVSMRGGSAIGVHDCLTPMHRQATKIAGFIVLDIICLPMILWILIFGYRFRTICQRAPGLRFHKTVARQCFEQVIDLPCLLAGLIVIIFVYRADQVLVFCDYRVAGVARTEVAATDLIEAGMSAYVGATADVRANTTGRPRFTARQRREGTLWQLVRLAGDIASLVPFAILVCTVYRLVPFVLSLKVRMSLLLREDPEMAWRSWRFVMDGPKGRPGVVVRARKSPNFSGIKSMRLQVVGNRFWDAVTSEKGTLAVAAARSALPLSLIDGRDVDFTKIEFGKSEVEIGIKVNYVLKQTTIRKFLMSLPDVDFLLQLEATLGNGRRTVLLAVPCNTSDWRQAFDVDAQAREAPEDQDEAQMREHLATLRGEPTLGRDVWCASVLTEFVKLLWDALHLVVCLLLIVAMPWRFVMFVRSFLEPPALRRARKLVQVVACVEAWERKYRELLDSGEQMANRYSKAAAELEPNQRMSRSTGSPPHFHSDMEGIVESCLGFWCCCWCCCFGHGTDRDPADYQRVRRHNYHRCSSPNIQKLEKQFRQRLVGLRDALRPYRSRLRKARKKWPTDDPSWEPLAKLIDALIQRRTEAAYWMLLLHHVHIVLAKGMLTRDDHSRVAQSIRNRALPLMQAAPGDIEDLVSVFRGQFQQAKSSGRYSCRKKGKDLLFTILREQLIKGVTDVICVPVLLLLCMTVYRLPRLRGEIVRNKGITNVKLVTKQQALDLVKDLTRLMQLIFLTAILTATIVKLPTFLSALEPRLGLRNARDRALEAVSELFVGILELLSLLTVLKTYQRIVSAIVFVALCPAAMLALALPWRDRTKARFAIASVLWLSLLACCYFFPGQLIMLTFAILMMFVFGGLCRGHVTGWTRPRSSDWWSSTVRCTFPNFLALLAIGCDAVVFAWVGRLDFVGGLGMEALPFSVATQGGLSHAVVGFVCGCLVLETLPMVCEEYDQPIIVTDHAWRAAIALVEDVLFMPLIYVLVDVGQNSWLHSGVLLFFLIAVLVGPAVWDVKVPYDGLLDIRLVGLNASGRKLLIFGAVAAAITGHHVVFLSLAAASSFWVLIWMSCGASVPWVEVLRLASSASAFTGWRVTLAIVLLWCGAIVLAIAVAAGGRLQRKRHLATSEVPVALGHLTEIQKRLRLWDNDSIAQTHGQPTVRADADVGLVAQQVLALEERIPLERLDLDFFSERAEWRNRLANAPDFTVVHGLLERLRAAVVVPVTRVLMAQLLSRVNIRVQNRDLYLPLAREIVGFAAPPVCLTSLNGSQDTDLDICQLHDKAKREAAKISKHIHSEFLQSKLGEKTARKTVNSHPVPCVVGALAETQSTSVSVLTSKECAALQIGSANFVSL
eukprot:TRINITY_DN31130_c0_g1_i1.p1 TRINITY_DN31130_c0_g1~~TRINITY_DN31130_c0_g1_i1.p1  ORF type:complete len:1602 (+),score=233.77 TRINITY_DN31130_c0_g1_i1:189-4994(+)